ncbi:AAA family ATPase [Cellulophaga sp. HaHa_2_95]|uniref:AAA family ATPase n=1 Tax=Cellulophaga sp. HaHa_2_95 TaxID=2745558 RepID=UPI002102CA58|nr:AAA family ATPase [Cellulophaga sp. HaHa_2_95]
MNYWAVGSSFGGTDDKTQEFIDNKNWFDGKYENGDLVNLSHLEKINLGDVLVMKSSATKGKNHSITFTKVKSIGVITKRLDTHKFKIDWLSSEKFPLDFDGLSYRKIIEPLRDDDIKKFVKIQLQKKEKMEITKLLKHKKQIILQGPPGTGKTRLAKEIAETLTAKIKTINPLQKIESFFKKFNASEDVKIHRQFVEDLNNTFLNKFKKENLKHLKLEDYALGTDTLDNFCYWIEYKLSHTGKYTGQANKGKIYWDSENEEYKKSGFVKDIENDEDAMKKVAELLDKIISEELDNYPIGKGFVLKILNTYHPDTYFPINSETCLSNFLKLVKEEDSSLNYIEKNKKVQAFFQSMKSKYNSDITNYEFMYFLFDNFDLKGTVVLENDELVAIGENKIIQFHPSYTYEDFVRGITVKSNEKSEIKYITENKVLADFAEKALNNKTSNYVLIIDEINRANLSSVLGELIYALEYRGEAVESMYEIAGNRKITLPPNLLIIGTMNTADRSVGQIDYAIRRRFAFVDVLPKVLSETDLNADRKENEPQLYFKEDVYLKVKELFLNNEGRNSEHLSDEFKAKDVQLGHSYFIYTEDNFKYNLNYEIKPILKEYVTDGILKSSALTEIEDL